MGRFLFLFASILCTMLLSSRLAAADTVRVLYAGSLVNLMEHDLGSAFSKKTGDRFQGYAGGSKALANQIKGKLRRGDIFVSASAAVDASLMGAANGDWIDWYVAFASSPLVIGYNPDSRFAAELKSKPWYQVLQEPGLRIGRTDPKLDPKGGLTVKLLNRAEQVYKAPGLARKILGSPENPTQVVPEETLVGRLQSGQIDVGFFYSTETKDLKIPEISLPAEVSLKAVYTAATLNRSADPAGAVRFLDFLLGPHGRSLLSKHGLVVTKSTASGTSAASIPVSLRGRLAAAQ